VDSRDLFNDKSDLYARARPRYPDSLYQWLASCCQGHRAVWDAACGNGQASADLRKYFDLVEATDISESQIANASVYERVRFLVQPAEATEFKDESFDAVCVAQALHWFDYEKFWPEVKRVLKLGGVFAAWGYTWPRLNDELDRILSDSLLTVIEPYWAPQNRLLWNGYKDVPLPFNEIETPQIDLTMTWSLDELFAYLHSWSATRRCMEKNGDGFFWASREKIRRVWGVEARRRVSMEFFLVAGRNGI
jgi:SAM-dependent methyltransferase